MPKFYKFKMRLIYSIFGLLFITNLHAQYDRIDSLARSCPVDSMQSITQVANYLKSISSTDKEIARSIYTWICENIRYDDKAFNEGTPSAMEPTEILKGKKAVCIGYAILYAELGSLCGIVAEVVTGYSKGYDYIEGYPLEDPDHAWNVVLIDGEFFPLDATWGAGAGETNKKGKLVSKKGFDDQWFLMQPEHAIFTHYAEYLPGLFKSMPAVSLKDFEHLPYLRPSMFTKNLLQPTAFFMQLTSNTYLFAPEVYDIPFEIKHSEVPHQLALKNKKSIKIEITTNAVPSIYVVDQNNQFTALKNDGGVFRLTYKPEVSGELKIVVQNDQHYYTLYQYEVR
jgi:hypothetical protein